MSSGFDEAALAAWLGATDLVVEGGPIGGGWSNETVFVRVDGRPVVVRLSPSGPSMFPAYDVGLQVRSLELTAQAGLPVPGVVAFEASGSVLGRPFFVMKRLAGRVPADDDPPFTKAGFLFEAGPEQQARFCRHAVDLIAAVHAVAAPGFLPVGSSPRAHLEWCAGLCRWAAVDHVDLSVAYDALASDFPPDDAAPVGLLWGDARPANMVVDDQFRITGLLDWELAATGPGELDVAWFLEMNRMRSVGMGITALPGFLSDGDTWQRWSGSVGRSPTFVGWHHRYAAYRVAVLLFLYLRAMSPAANSPMGTACSKTTPAPAAFSSCSRSNAFFARRRPPKRR